VEPTDFLK
jgi:hypothetical protein